MCMLVYENLIILFVPCVVNTISRHIKSQNHSSDRKLLPVSHVVNASSEQNLSSNYKRDYESLMWGRMNTILHTPSDP